MPHARFKAIVDAPFDRVQDLLLDKIEHPKKYVGTIQSSRILERGDGFVLREMNEPLPSGMVIRERIERRKVPSGEDVVYEQVDGERYTGSFHNILTRVDENDACCELEYVMNWTPAEGTTDPIGEEQAQRMVRRGVEQLKHMAEHPPQIPDFVRDFYRAVDGMDPDAIGPLIADDIRFRIGSHSDIVGKEEVLRVNRMVLGQWKRITHHFLDAYQDKGATFTDCFVHYRMHDDREYLLPFVSMMEQRDGKISSIKIFGDLSPMIHGWPDH